MIPDVIPGVIPKNEIMKYPTVRVVFDRKKQATRQKTGLVQIEVMHDRKRVYFSTGVKVYAGQWKDTVMVVGRMDSIELNDRIHLLTSEVREYINEVIKSKRDFSLDDLKGFMQSKGNDDNSFLDFMEKRIEEHSMKESTRKQHRVVLRKLLDFGKIQVFKDLTTKNIKLFDEFIRSTVKEQSSVHGIHKRLKVYVKDAILFDLLEKNPYDGIVIPRGDDSKNRKYLTFEELDKIRKAEINDNSISRARDCFVFCCFTGLAYADLLKFNWDKDVVEENGKHVIKDTRQKTGVSYNITLLPPAMEILERYNYRLPVITNQQYNLRLKVLSSYAGVQKKLTSHVARHTFATWALSTGVKMEVVSKMLAHNNIRTTQIYAKILQKDVMEGFDLLENRIREGN